MNKLEPWMKFFDELTLHEAALLAIGEHPEKYARRDGQERVPLPKNYEVSKLALCRALEFGRIQYRDPAGKTTHEENTPNLRPRDNDVYSTMIDFKSFESWLAERGVTLASLFPEERDMRDCTDRNHPYYAIILHVANYAWEEAQKHPLAGRTPKQLLEKIIRDNAAKLGILKPDGSVDEGIVEQAAKAANWKRQGGSPETPAIRSVNKETCLLAR